MGLCNDKAITFLRDKGYNVVRHPNVGFRPLTLVGRQNGAVSQLGPLNLLITNPGPLPKVTSDQTGAGISGTASSKVDFKIGVNVLGAIIGAMGGGNLGADLSFTNAEKIEFRYEDVLLDSVVPLEVGNYLRDGDVDDKNLILKEFVLGDGDLFLVTRVVKSKKFTVSFERKNGVGANVNVPALQGVAGGSVSITKSAGADSVVTFDGPVPLAFGFECFQVGVADGILSLHQVRPGGIAASVAGAAEEKGVLLSGPGLLGITQ